MLRKFFLICLIGWLSIVSVPNTAWANSSPTSMPASIHWLAQAKPNVQIIPSESPKLDSSTETVKPPAESSTSDHPPTRQVSPDQPLTKKRASSQPFNPYDMKALKQFDKGSHRAK